MKGKTPILAKFHRTDLLFVVILERGKPCLTALHFQFEIQNMLDILRLLIIW